MTSREPSGASEPGVLDRVLEDSRRLGFLGPGPLAPQIEHARGFASTVERTPESFLDLGSGGGLPGLVLATVWPHARGVLLDSMARRTQFLREACDRLALGAQMEVVCARAEDAARRPELRERFALVTARSFGPPAVTAECATGFLVDGGLLVVSEPPEDHVGRWPDVPLAELGLTVVRGASPVSRYVVLRRTGRLDARWPRRTGIPAKRPLWG